MAYINLHVQGVLHLSGGNRNCLLRSNSDGSTDVVLLDMDKALDLENFPRFVDADEMFRAEEKAIHELTRQQLKLDRSMLWNLCATEEGRTDADRINFLRAILGNKGRSLQQLPYVRLPDDSLELFYTLDHLGCI